MNGVKIWIQVFYIENFTSYCSVLLINVKHLVVLDFMFNKSLDKGRLTIDYIWLYWLYDHWLYIDYDYCLLVIVSI